MSDYEVERQKLEVAELLLTKMEELGVSRMELARRVGRTKGYVSQVLSGKQNMTLKTMVQLAWALGLRVEVIVQDIYDE